MKVGNRLIFLIASIPLDPLLISMTTIKSDSNTNAVSMWGQGYMWNGDTHEKGASNMGKSKTIF